MRVLLLNQAFYPDVVATAQHADDLARHLVAQGHEVTAIASRSIYGSKGAALPRRETVDGVEIRRVGASVFGKRGILARILDFALFYLLATVRTLTVRRPDVIVCFTTPPFIALVGWLARLLRGSKYVYWVMDLYPDLPVACGVMQARSPVTWFFERVNRFCLRRADRVVVLGRCMRDRVVAKGVAPERIDFIGVWSDAEEVRPTPRSENAYRREWGVGDATLVMYSGNFGLGHDVQTMCEAAEALRENPSVRFAFVGGGKRKEEVEAFVRERGLENVVLAPYQPRERLGELLSAGDVHLASLKEGIEGIMVPSKLFGIMAASRPTLFVGHPTSEIARVLTERDCGVVIREGDAPAMVEAILALDADPAERDRLGANARRALAEVYDRRSACAAWTRVLEDVVNPAPQDAEKQADAAS